MEFIYSSRSYQFFTAIFPRSRLVFDPTFVFSRSGRCRASAFKNASITNVAFLCVSIWSERRTGCPLNGEPTNLSRACSLSINKVPCGSDVRQFGRRLPFRFVWQKIILNRCCTRFLCALFSWQMIEMRFNCSWQRLSSTDLSNSNDNWAFLVSLSLYFG